MLQLQSMGGDRSAEGAVPPGADLQELILNS